MNRGLWHCVLAGFLLAMVTGGHANFAWAATYAPVKARDTRMLNIVRRYDIPVIPGQKNVAAIPAMLSFWGATNQQIILKSSFTYSVKPDRIRITADNLGMKRRNYELTWNSPAVSKIVVTQNLLVKLHYDAVLYTSACLPYAPKVLGACPSNGRDCDGSEMSRRRGGGSSRLLIMSLRDPTTKQTGQFRPTRRAACFLAPLCGAAPRSTIRVRYAIVAAS